MFRFYFGRKRPLIEWLVYSVGVAGLVSLTVMIGNGLLQSKHGSFIRDAACSTAKKLPDNDLKRLLSSFCRIAEDGEITPEEAKTLVGRAQQVSGVGSIYFDNDRENTSLRAKDEVSFAIEEWKRLNPSPKIDNTLRKQFPELSEDQLCVLSQAERYTDGDAIGIRYVGMKVCESE